jgi:competence protein ComEC
MRAVIVCVLLLMSVISNAQYLESYGINTLRVLPKSNSESVIASDMKKGDWLHLLDSGKQTNGYYHARIHGEGIDGWIYRSRAKRINVPMPHFLEDNAGVEIYIVDVGAGLGCTIKTPSGKYIIYDGGNGNHVYNFLKSLYKTQQEVEYVIVSHTDSDHWGAIKAIANDYDIKQALYTSYRPDGLVKAVKEGIQSLKDELNISLLDIADTSIAITPDFIIYQEKDFSLRFLSGFGKHDSAFAKGLGTNASKLRNAASIVIQLEYMGKTVLFTGDIVGLKECNKVGCRCEYDCNSTEKYLLDSMNYYLDSDVIIAPHYGARNGSCPKFIEAVSPEYVIFSAGNRNKHPHNLTAINYQTFGGVLPENIQRTDLGQIPKDHDKNLCNNEWIGVNTGRIDKDTSMDDHIKIQITSAGKLLVDYLE